MLLLRKCLSLENAGYIIYSSIIFMHKLRNIILISIFLFLDWWGFKRSQSREVIKSRTRRGQTWFRSTLLLTLRVSKYTQFSIKSVCRLKIQSRFVQIYFFYIFRRYFIDHHALTTHFSTKVHKRRLKDLELEPYTIEESERAAGKGNFILPKRRKIVTQSQNTPKEPEILVTE